MFSFCINYMRRRTDKHSGRSYSHNSRIFCYLPRRNSSLSEKRCRRSFDIHSTRRSGLARLQRCASRVLRLTRAYRRLSLGLPPDGRHYQLVYQDLLPKYLGKDLIRDTLRARMYLRRADLLCHGNDPIYVRNRCTAQRSTFALRFTVYSLRYFEGSICLFARRRSATCSFVACSIEKPKMHVSY